MTTFKFNIKVDDSEIIMLEYALELMMDHCREKIEQGIVTPYKAHLRSAKDVQLRLKKNPENSSYNSF